MIVCLLLQAWNVVLLIGSLAIYLAFYFFYTAFTVVFKQDWQVSVEHIAIAHGVDNKTIGSNGVMQVGTD